MEVFTASFGSAFIIFMTVFFIIKAFIKALKRKEISVGKFRAYTAASVLIGVMTAAALPFAYEKMFDILR
ncbi:hypothetical protein V1498_12875 [Peribacillus sp. SCS-26]|uniref:hypothetical protein n=1 Tax=Paraperibacillus marinus TaxID=3115295 RepID=UPI003905EB7C